MSDPTLEEKIEDLSILAQVVDAEWLRDHGPGCWDALDRQLDDALDRAGASRRVRDLAHRIRREIRWARLEDELAGYGRSG